MSDSKKPTVSEIRARLSNPDVAELLDLVERMGKLAELVLAEVNPVNVLGPPVVTHEMEEKARALLEELKQ